MRPYFTALEEISRFESEHSYISRQFLESRSGGALSSTIELSMTKIRELNQNLFTEIIQKPYLYVPAIEEYVNSNHYVGAQSHRVSVVLTGDITADHTTMPRNLNSSCLKQLFKVRGIVTKLLAPRPSISRLIEFQPGTGTFAETIYEDPYTTIAPETMRAFILRQHSMLFVDGDPGQTSTTQGAGSEQNNAAIVSLGVPGAAPAGSKLHKTTTTQTTVREYGLSLFDSIQRIVLQDHPEDVPSGRLPRSIPVILRSHLVDRCKSGDLVEVIGIFNPSVHHRAGEAANTKSSSVGNFLLALSINVVERTQTQIRYISTTEEQVVSFLKRCTDISQWIRHSNKTRLTSLSGYALDVLTASFAPAIYGHWTVKRGIVLQLLQGVPREFSSSSRIRGDINILLIGDPGSAKSQMLRVVKQLIPISVQTTGRGSSGVGLTAAVVIDGTTGERRLDPGAAVLADRGVLLIDEFDKVEADDRALLHEALEQQSISISKAGLHCTLNARCSVLAAANPIYGFFDPKRSFADNIALPDSLLSRYDLVFLVKDDYTMDAQIASHVLFNHMTSMSLDDLKTIHEQRRTVEQGIMENIGETLKESTLNVPGDECVQSYVVNKAGFDGYSDDAGHIPQVYDMYSDPDLKLSARSIDEYISWIKDHLTQDGNTDTPLSFNFLSPLCFQTFNENLHSTYVKQLEDAWDSNAYRLNRARALVSREFLRDIIKYARSQNKTGPYLSEQAVKQVSKCYTDLRQRVINSRRHPPNIPVTARILESLIRLATALTKLSFPPREVEPEDVIEAYILLVTCIYNEKDEDMRKVVCSNDPPEEGTSRQGPDNAAVYSIVVRAISAYTEEHGLTTVQLSEFFSWFKGWYRTIENYEGIEEPTNAQMEVAITKLVENQVALLEDNVLFILT